MRFTERREKLRAVLEGDACVHPATVFDPISARIAEDIGYELGILSGSIASFAVLGAPDIVVLTLTEFTEQARRVCRAGELPLLVDADHGYGNALNVMRTVEELEWAGVAALSIEDTVLPRTFGEGKTQLLSIDEGVGKMRAALEARRDSRLIIAGRTTFGLTGPEDTIARVAAYEKAGVDAIFVVRVQTREQLEAIAAAVIVPIILGGSPSELNDRDWLGSQGVRVALQGHRPFLAAVQAVQDTLRALREGVPPQELKGIASDETIKNVTRAGDYARWTEDFLGGK